MYGQASGLGRGDHENQRQGHDASPASATRAVSSRTIAAGLDERFHAACSSAAPRTAKVTPRESSKAFSEAESRIESISPPGDFRK